ncbi:MAG: SDR family NAD(P)-dependent oxidoreductase [Pirellulaceae bacterium]|jgi:3-oxoacyl-[acyl-carrier protein] reductase|nr:SDR family NAD(P)-dependent oxidoreductase [Pirellulaceae bacterium]MDP7015900.1 SDR family NAD(P)-dependent oxidoreductase [Pirellulaceae bacterium]
MGDGEFAGRTALVTGGAKGIGRACCDALAEQGARVAINYLSSREQAERAAADIRERGGQARAFAADVSQHEQVEQLVRNVEDELGPIDLLVNNAGVFDFVAHDETTPELWRRTLDCNLTSAYLVSWAVKTSMIERRFGRIVNVASIAALRARPMSIAYAVSKAGMVALTKSLAEAVAEHGVRVNAIAPGLIQTEILDGVDQASLDALIAATPMKRIGQPDDISDVVVFLLSDRSRFMTGQTLVASGGRVKLP